MKKYAQVVLGVPLDKAFTYSIPEAFRDSVKVGQRVAVPFGRRNSIGYIVDFLEETPLKEVKAIEQLLDQEPLLDSQMLKLTREIAQYYCASWGEVIEAAFPANVRKRKTSIGRICPLPLSAEHYADIPDEQRLSLHPQQRRVLNLIKTAMEEKKYAIFLLHGITASGKTEIYLQTIARVLARGRASIVLVPEIALTPQTVDRFRSRFGETVALLHSRLSSRQRAAQWRMIKDGRAQIVIGARSAVFAPVKDLGLIVIDEEHETTYKEREHAPRYHAREVALMRAKLAQACVILGSATPSLESFYQAKQEQIKLLSLPQRVTKRDLPPVEIIDMRKEIAIRRKRANILSRSLEMKLRQVLARREQAILFLNRRGFSTFVSCAKCGYVARCKRCNVSLTYHYNTKKLVCHYCNYNLSPPQICPQCSSTYLRYAGLGTEKVESELHRLFPQARIARMDSDVTVEHSLYRKLLTDFKEGRIDILVGTQMVAKGLDFPRVSLVGVVSADTALNLPDFRSGERTFNLLTQVAGRAGRGEVAGRVVIQTYVPEHYALMASIKHDYYQFYRKEIKSRRTLKLPPFTHLISLTLRGRNQQRTQGTAEDLFLRLKQQKPAKEIKLLGPAPAAVSKIRGHFHWNILLKGKNIQRMVGLLKEVLKDCKRYKGVPLIVDVDPI